MRKRTLFNVAIRSLVLATLIVSLVGCKGSKGKPEPTKDIIETITAEGDFDTLAAAIEAAGLTDTLKGQGPFTLFAPDDDAFEKLPAGTLDTLMLPENKERLAAILTYHVIADKVMSADMLGMRKAKTVNGKSLQIETEAGTIRVNRAKVIKTDIICTNGVIHIIDAVVMPR